MFRHCWANKSSNGPEPARTNGTSGDMAADFSRVCSAPTVITPGRVQPGTGTGRSIAPVATITWPACIRVETPSQLTHTSRSGVTCQTRLLGR